MKEVVINKSLETTANDAAEAVGVAISEQKHWYIAIVKHGNEKICGKILTDLGYENYVAVQRELRQYASGRKKWKDRLDQKGRVRRMAIVAMARQLLVALWRYVVKGETIEGAIMNKPITEG